MTRRMIVAALALAGIFVALYLTLYKLGLIGELSCSIGSCETVNSTPWAVFLGAPVAAWGVGFYVVTFAVAMAGTQGRYAESPQVGLVLVLLSAVGVAFSAWLTYLELFVIHAICQWCVVSAVIVTAIFVVSLLDHLDRRGAGDVAGESKV
ncbi:MAG TPA: vitamin K epoxide reductase family protein [Gemmatimonadaceae bacterium]|nr:vitamin K epoxide reductase family protein [Gemmatimonadaceae bacterium]